MIERRSEQQHQFVAFAHQIASPPIPSRAALCAGSPAPEITAQDCGSESIRASSIHMRTERRAVVEVSPQIPFAVPRRALDRCLQWLRRRRHCEASFARRLIRPAARTLRAPLHRNHPSHTLSPLPFRAHQVHPVVPVAVAHQRQSMRSQLPAAVERPRAMLPEASAVCDGDVGTNIFSCSPAPSAGPSINGICFIQNAGIAR